MKSRRTRTVLFPVLWCAGGIIYGDPEVCKAIHKILLDEQEHKQQGEANAPNAGKVDAAVGVAAHIGAAASKGLAERL